MARGVRLSILCPPPISLVVRYTYRGTLLDGLGGRALAVRKSGFPLKTIHPTRLAFDRSAFALLPFAWSERGSDSGCPAVSGTARTRFLVNRVLACSVVAMLSVPALAQWTVTSLQHFDSSESSAVGVGAGQQIGNSRVYSPSGEVHASLWSGTASSWIDLNPQWSEVSYANGVWRGRQVGMADIGNVLCAVIWSGTPESYICLSRPEWWSSGASGIFADQQVGGATIDGVPHASLWRGSAESWVDLHPAGAEQSGASGVADGEQVGNVLLPGLPWRAGLWRGTAESWTDLNPAGATTSTASAVSMGLQVGHVRIGNETHASLWRGTSASWVDLNPSGCTVSWTSGAFAGRQVGKATIGGVVRASLWSGTAESWSELPVPVTGTWSYAWAKNIWADATSIYVVGEGYNETRRRTEALLWTRPNCVADVDDGSRLGNPDDGVAIDDLLYYLTIYADGVARADVDDGTGTGTPDGGVTIDDLLYFLQRFEAGC